MESGSKKEKGYHRKRIHSVSRGSPFQKEVVVWCFLSMVKRDDECYDVMLCCLLSWNHVTSYFWTVPVTVARGLPPGPFMVNNIMNLFS